MHLVLDGRTGAVVELPGGLQAERTYGEVVIAPAPSEKAVSTQEWTLPIPGRVPLRELGLEIAATRSRAKRPPPSPMAAILNAAKIEGPLLVRTRRRGDRFRPIGMKGTVKLQDFFVNTKIPRAQRDRVPLVLSGDEIVWVVGYRVSEGFKVTDKTRRSIRLEATRLT
jgi:tRNA(Ile)-lysidine synthase